MTTVGARRSVCILHVVSGDLYAGAERVVEELAIAQNSSAETTVRVVLFNEGELARRLRAYGVPSDVYPETQFAAVPLLRRLSLLARQTKPDVIHTHRFKEHILGSLAARSCGAASIRTVHGAPEYQRNGSLRARLIGHLDRGAARFLQQRTVYVSDELRHGQMSSGECATVIRNGIDPARVERASKNEVEQLSGELRVGIFARLVPVKRVDVAIEAVAEASRLSGRAIALHIFGDGPLRDALERQARRHASSFPIAFHGHTSNALAYMRQMDALLLTSSHEGLPVAVLEAMSLGVAVVATRSGGLPEVLSGGECGWLVDPQDLPGYATSLLSALDATPHRNAKVQRALERVAKVFSVQHMSEQYLNLYRTVLAERTGALALSPQ
jgi:L-malate glycosyltransferase